MSYESRAYDEPARDGFGPDPVVVLVVKGTHDVSRLVNLFAGASPNIEQLQVGKQIVAQVRRDSGGRAALRLLAAHGGTDFTASLPGLTDGALEVLRLLAAGKTVREAAATLFMSESGTAMRLLRAREAVGVRTNEHLMALCVQRGLVEPGPLRAGKDGA